jgi:hypothetical protein
MIALVAVQPLDSVQIRGCLCFWCMRAPIRMPTVLFSAAALGPRSPASSVPTAAHRTTQEDVVATASQQYEALFA